MPYIPEDQRIEIDEWLAARPPLLTEGQLAYLLTRLLTLTDDEEPRRWRFSTIASAVGVLETVKLELYRRVAAPYEDQKRDQNGEVYG